MKRMEVKGEAEKREAYIVINIDMEEVNEF